MALTVEQREEFKVKSEHLVERVKELAHQGNVRRIIVKNEGGQTFIEVPLTVGAVGAMMLPVWVALGAIAALANNYTLEVETRE